MKNKDDDTITHVNIDLNILLYIFLVIFTIGLSEHENPSINEVIRLDHAPSYTYLNGCRIKQ
jgi:hypothetical protein